MSENADVLGHRHVGEKRIVLEDHGDVALLGATLLATTFANRDLAARNLFQARDHSKKRSIFRSQTARPA